MHNTNSLLKYVAIPVLIVVFLFVIVSVFKGKKEEKPLVVATNIVKNKATEDSAAESLETLTSELQATKIKIDQVAKNNEALKAQNVALKLDLQKQERSKKDEKSAWFDELGSVKSQLHAIQQNSASDPNHYVLNGAKDAAPILVVNDLTLTSTKGADNSKGDDQTSATDQAKKNVVPFFTIPANATSVKDRLMTALVGRIPVKGVVVDPYPFKIVISDDNLAANGLRIPHLLQMIVSGYAEGDLVLKGVRGWVTSLTFVFDDGTISSTTSNNNDIGNFTKANALGYLSDEFGNPYLRGKKFITDAPTILGVDMALAGSTGAANAYAQAQTTTNSSAVGGASTTSVTGSQAKFVGGQMLSGSFNAAGQWWSDRVSQSFDAVYVPPVDDQGRPIEVVVNFTKEIHIDYDKNGRKLSYANNANTALHPLLD